LNDELKRRLSCGLRLRISPSSTSRFVSESPSWNAVQTKRSSLIEAACNVGSGFVLSVGIYQLVLPMLGYHITLADNIGITCLFTVVAVLRSYFWRRLFNTTSRSKLSNTRGN
jgi:hypothetical protein